MFSFPALAESLSPPTPEDFSLQRSFQENPPTSPLFNMMPLSPLQSVPNQLNSSISSPVKQPRHSVDSILQSKDTPMVRNNIFDSHLFRTSSPLPGLVPSSVPGHSTGNNYLQKLQSNPMFGDLKEILAQECLHLQVPANLITTNWSSVQSTGETNLQIYVNHMHLQEDFVKVRSKPHMTLPVLKLENQYCTEVGRIEMGRYQALYSNMQNIHVKQAVNIYYDKERLTLISRIKEQLKKLETDSENSPVSDIPLSECEADSALDLSCRENDGSPESSKSGANKNDSGICFSPVDLSNHSDSRRTLFQSPNSDQSSSSVCNSPDSTTDLSSATNTSSKSGRSLHPRSTRHLQEWYERNIHYPYPADTDVEKLCRVTELSATQVKKWMANKRVRSYNTLSISGNDHPIKVRSHKRRVCDDADDSNNSNSAKRGSYTQISMEARNILTDWYDSHSDKPYPTEEEKIELADKCAITVNQVKSWFANKRSRNQNTKKQVPNYFIKKFPQYYPLVQMVKHKKEISRLNSDNMYSSWNML